ncbi:MAG TPA: hypothetical protein VJB91_00525 [Patescibacteria group bacterium]|nr:hypothetical protein [Patescibacteria group bacterium]
MKSKKQTPVLFYFFLFLMVLVILQYLLFSIYFLLGTIQSGITSLRLPFFLFFLLSTIVAVSGVLNFIGVWQKRKQYYTLQYLFFGLILIWGIVAQHLTSLALSVFFTFYWFSSAAVKSHFGMTPPLKNKS